MTRSCDCRAAGAVERPDVEIEGDRRIKVIERSHRHATSTAGSAPLICALRTNRPDKDHVDWSMVVTGPEEKIVVELPAKTNLPQAVKTRRTGRWRCWYSICFEALLMSPNGTFPNDNGELRQICSRLQRRGRILAAWLFSLRLAAWIHTGEAPVSIGRAAALAFAREGVRVVR